MTGKRLTAVIIIYVVTSIAWMILSSSNTARTESTYSRLGTSESSDSGRSSVQDLWGQPQQQPAPAAWFTHTEKTTELNSKGKKVSKDIEVTTPVTLSSSRVKADITSEPRRKGLLWYRTYKVRFSGDYTVKNETGKDRTFFVQFGFPAQQAVYDNVSFVVNGKRIEPTGDLQTKTSLMLKAGEKAKLHMSYGSQGMDTWHYKFSNNGTVSNVKDFQADISTNCKDIDFPSGCVSPTDKQMTGDGWNLTWKYANLVSGFNIGVSLPQKLNPGPFSAKLSSFAPVSLLFFFAVLIILGAVKGIRLHPMHYVFLAAAFFSFHLLFSYMVDHVTPFYSFLVSSAVSLLLVISYLRLVVDWKFAVFHAGFWQFVFLVLFTYAFFFEGYTGLTITIGTILTLAAMMQFTGKVNWEEKLSSSPPAQTGQ